MLYLVHTAPAARPLPHGPFSPRLECSWFWKVKNTLRYYYKGLIQESNLAIRSPSSLPVFWLKEEVLSRIWFYPPTKFEPTNKYYSPDHLSVCML